MKNILVLAMSTLFFAPIGCNKDEYVDTSDVDEIARDFLRGISDDQAQRVYKAHFSEELQHEKASSQWIETAGMYRLRLGYFISLQLTGSLVQRIEGRGEGRIEYSVQWEKAKGTLVLNITEEDGWKIRSFEIRSPLFQEAVHESGRSQVREKTPLRSPEKTP